MRHLVETADFPDDFGVYVLYESATARQPVYVGKAHKQTVKERWSRNHLKDRAGGSALRRSLAPHLGLVDQKLSVARDGRYYPAPVEQAITNALRSYFIEWYTTATGEEAGALEKDLIKKLDPVLNIQS